MDEMTRNDPVFKTKQKGFCTGKSGEMKNIDHTDQYSMVLTHLQQKDLYLHLCFIKCMISYFTIMHD